MGQYVWGHSTEGAGSERRLALLPYYMATFQGRRKPVHNWNADYVARVMYKQQQWERSLQEAARLAPLESEQLREERLWSDLERPMMTFLPGRKPFIFSPLGQCLSSARFITVRRKLHVTLSQSAATVVWLSFKGLWFVLGALCLHNNVSEQNEGRSSLGELQ